jgi:general secretion pathway protein I
MSAKIRDWRHGHRRVSWRDLVRPSTTRGADSAKVVDGRHKPGHDTKGRAADSWTGLRSQGGFTLIEVLIALVITLIALAVLTGGIAGSLRAASGTGHWIRAISHAESHMAAITDPGRMLGERRGRDGDGYRWLTRVAFVTSAPAPDGVRGGAWAHGTGLYAVSVTIFWHEGRAERSFVLEGARLGPLAGS